MSEPGVRIERLRPDHGRAEFSCGDPTLDRYFREQVGQDIRRGVANCFLAVDGAAATILGFYTLAATGIPLGAVPDAMRRKLPAYPLLPAALIGRLAVDSRHQRRRVGSVMLIDAGMRALNSDPAVYALVVDAKNESAAEFYRRSDFIPFASEPRRMFLPLATFRKALLS